MRNIPAILLLTMFCTGLVHGQSTFIKASSHALSYEGRVLLRGDSASLSWSGNSVQVRFKGTSISGTLNDEHGKNYLKVIVDGRVMPDVHLDSVKHQYQFAAGLSNTFHILKLFKRTEWVFGKTWFYGFELGNRGKVEAKLNKPAKRIEFYGNSITCGYGVIDSTGKDRGTPEFEDGYLSYAAITARNLNASYTAIARSGIGIMVSWFPQIMPELYDRLDPADSLSKWDFKTSRPDIVVINLLQNDSWIVKLPDSPQFKAKFGSTAPTNRQIIDAYKSFINKIRSCYPEKPIICALGNMDITRKGSPWPGYVSTAVQELHDPLIYTHFFIYKNTPGHPKVAEQQATADDLTAYIRQKMNW